MSQPKEATNLIADTAFADWISISFSSVSGDWTISDGIIKQNIQTSESKSASGTALLHPDNLTNESSVIGLQVMPGGQYYSGLVFNYVDENNFVLFTINEFSSSYTGHRILIIEVVDGQSSIILDKKLDEEPSPELLLFVEFHNSGLVFYLNNSIVFRWEDQKLKPAKIGLYNQQNDSTSYLFLGTAGASLAPKQPQPIDQTTITPEDALREEYKALDNFDPFLKINPPNSETQVEFHEVFTVPLDSFYVSMFQNPQLAGNELKTEDLPGVAPSHSIQDQMTIEIGQTNKYMSFDLLQNNFMVWEYEEPAFDGPAIITSNVFDKTTLERYSSFQMDPYIYELPLGSGEKTVIYESKTAFILLDFSNWEEKLLTSQAEDIETLFSQNGDWIYFSDSSGLKFSAVSNLNDVQSLALAEEFHFSFFQSIGEDQIVVYSRKKEADNVKSNIRIYAAGQNQILFETVVGSHLNDGSVMVSPNGLYVVIKGSELIHLFSFDTGDLITSFKSDHYFKDRFAFIQNDTQMVLVNPNDERKLILLETATGLTETLTFQKRIRALIGLSNSDLLIASEDIVIRYNLTQRKNIASEDISPYSSDYWNFTTWIPDEANKRLLIQYGDNMHMVNIETLQKLSSTQVGSNKMVRFSTDKSKVISEEKIWKILPDNSFEEVNPLNHLPNQTRIKRISDNGRYVIGRTQDDNELIIWDSTEKKIINSQGDGFNYSIQYDESIYFEELSPNDTKIIFYKNASSVAVKHGELKEQIPVALPETEMFLASGSPDGKYILIINRQIQIEIWDVEMKSFVANLSVYNNDVSFENVIWLSDSQHILATSSSDIYLYDVHGSVIRTYSSGNMYTLTKIAAPQSSGVFASISRDMHIRVWEMNTGQLLQEIEVAYYNGHSLSISPDGKKLGYQSGKKEFSIFDSNDGSIIKSYALTDEDNYLTTFSQDSSRVVIVASENIQSFAVPSLDTVVIEDSMSLTRSFQLDYRPKTWYRIYRHSHDEEQLYSNVSNNYADLISSLSEDWSGLTHDQIEDNLLKIEAYKQHYQNTKALQYEARDIRQDILHQIRTSEYSLLDVDGNGTLEIQNAYRTDYEGSAVGSELISKGYNFAIIQGRPKFRKFDPVRISSNDFSNDEKWAIISADFNEKLFRTNAVSEEKQALFLAELDQLKNFDSNKELVKDKNLNLDGLEQAGKRKIFVSGQDKTIKSDIEIWEKDKLKVQALASGYDHSRAKIAEFIRFYGQINAESFDKFQIKSDLTIGSKTRKETEKVRSVGGLFKAIFIGMDEVSVTTSYYTYTIQHFLKNSKKPNLIFKYSDDERDGQSTSFSTGETYYFLNELVRVINANINELTTQLGKNQIELQELDEKIATFQTTVQTLDDYGLENKRKDFLKYWNDPTEFGALDLLDDPIRPDSDPIADLLEMLRSEYRLDESGRTLQIDYFNHNGRRFYNQNGLSMPAYLKHLEASADRHVAFFPTFSDEGKQDDQLFRGVVNPKPAYSRNVRLPKIKFAETYTIKIKWLGPHLGELSHTENLFPAEAKEIIVEKSTELIRKMEQSQLDSELSTTNTTSSFEEKLNKEFTLKEDQKSEKEDKYKNNEKTTSEDTLDIVTKNKNQYDLNIDFKGKEGLLTSLLGAKGKVESKLKIHRDKDITDKKKDTFERRHESSGKMANKESRESFSKDVQNIIKRVVNETSRENKVEVKVNVSEEYSQKSSSKETISLENPNVGRTVNYNFYQVQNRYEVETYLSDVKIIIDPDEEVVKGSGLSDVRVYELEEIGKIFADSDTSDNKMVITSAIAARQVFKNYLKQVPGIGQGNGALALPDTFIPDLDKFKSLFFSRDMVDVENYEGTLMSDLRDALGYLKSLPFVFKEVLLNESSTHSVNAGAYYLDAEVGKQPATEQYLENWRNIESEQKLAELDHLRAKTESGVFHQKLPENLQSLDLRSKE